MKKYIAPTVEVVCYKPEASMLLSLSAHTEVGGAELSNGRDDDFNSWED